MIASCAELAADLVWETLRPDTRSRLPLVVLDALGCAVAAGRRGVCAPLVQQIAGAGGPAHASLWSGSLSVPAAHAALVNGALVHHFDHDDGCPGASVHGGSTIVPTAIACGEMTRASGREVLAAIAAGYAVAVACGRPLRGGVDAHNLHPPAMLGVFGATAAAGRLLGLSAPRLAHALNLAATLLPIAPFEAFTRGATIKSLYAGWPAFAGVTCAILARSGVHGPSGVFDRREDGLGTFLNHAPVHALPRPDPDEVLRIEFKRYAACRAVHAALSALETLLPLRACDVAEILVETYPFPFALGADADTSTPVGAQTSVSYCAASLLLDGEVGPDAFSPEAIAEPERRELASRVTLAIADDMVEPLTRGARVTVVMTDGSRRQSSVAASRWSAAEPASDDDLRQKFERNTGGAARLLDAVARLESAADLGDLVGALRAACNGPLEAAP